MQVLSCASQLKTKISKQSKTRAQYTRDRYRQSINIKGDRTVSLREDIPSSDYCKLSSHKISKFNRNKYGEPRQVKGEPEQTKLDFNSEFNK